MAKVLLKDLLINGEKGVQLLNEVRDLIIRRKESVLDNAVKEFKPDELILMNPFDSSVSPEDVERILDFLKPVPEIRIFPWIDVYESVILPENVNILNEFEDSWEFSSCPVNNVPKVYLEEKGILELDVSPVWIIEISPEDPAPVSTIEDFVKNMRTGILVAVLYTYLLKTEEEAINSFVEETGGFVINLSKQLPEPKDTVETEFVRRAKNRVGKYLGMKALRGEIV